MSCWIVCCGDPSAAGLIAAPPPPPDCCGYLTTVRTPRRWGEYKVEEGRLPPAPRPCGRLLPPTRTPNRWPVGWAVFGARHDEGRTGLGRRRLSRAPFIISFVSRRFFLSLVVFPWFRALRRAFFFQAGLRGRVSGVCRTAACGGTPPPCLCSRPVSAPCSPSRAPVFLLCRFVPAVAPPRVT